MKVTEWNNFWRSVFESLGVQVTRHADPTSSDILWLLQSDSAEWVVIQRKGNMLKPKPADLDSIGEVLP